MNTQKHEVCTLSREDLLALDFAIEDVDRLTDEDLQRIAASIKQALQPMVSLMIRHIVRCYYIEQWVSENGTFYSDQGSPSL